MLSLNMKVKKIMADGEYQKKVKEYIKSLGSAAAGRSSESLEAEAHQYLQSVGHIPRTSEFQAFLPR